MKTYISFGKSWKFFQTVKYSEKRGKSETEGTASLAYPWANGRLWPHVTFNSYDYYARHNKSAICRPHMNLVKRYRIAEKSMLYWKPSD